MAKTIILTIIGPDKPGLVDDLSAVITEHGGSWLESRMSKLSGYFAGILRISVPKKSFDAIQEALKAMESNGLSLQIECETVEKVEVPHRDVHLEIMGPDHPGIVHDIAHALAEKSISIADLSSECIDGAMSGEKVFHAAIVASIPKEVSLDDTREELEDLANKLMVDITMDDLEGTVTRI